MKSVGIVLSGGGARGAAHLGVLKALNELNIKVSAISGVSAGAIVGVLYAAGYSPEYILAELKKQSYFGITNIAWQKDGFFSMASLRKKLHELIKQDDFEGLRIPLSITATDISTGKSIIFSKGPLFDVIIASASVPVIFQAVSYESYQLLDGGILNNLPVEPLLGKCDIIIGSHVNKLHDNTHPVKSDRISLIDECFHLMIANNVRERAMACDIFIEPLLSGFGIFEMKYADRIFEMGYEATMVQKEKLLASI